MNTDMNSPYIRYSLTATATGIIDADALVDSWLDEFLELVEEFQPGDEYDVLALYGRLERVRFDLIRATGREAAWKAARDKVQAQLAHFAAQALRIPNPEGWLAEAQALADACDDGLADELAEWAADLLYDLDDADLVAWAARTVGLASPDEPLQRCKEWLANNCDRFFPAGVLIQAIGQTLQPDLPALDLDLMATADKFVLLLDALEEAEADMRRLAVIPPQRVQPARDPAWNWLSEPQLMMAAQTRQSAGLKRYRWRSPDGAFVALLVANPEAPATEPVRLTLDTTQGRFAVELAGQEVCLAGCTGRVDADGCVDLDRVALTKAWETGASFKQLLVGTGQQPWTAVAED
jgi:hypothetical protein